VDLRILRHLYRSWGEIPPAHEATFALMKMVEAVFSAKGSKSGRGAPQGQVRDNPMALMSELRSAGFSGVAQKCKSPFN
jgi:hypothetical protein